MKNIVLSFGVVSLCVVSAHASERQSRQEKAGKKVVKALTLAQLRKQHNETVRDQLTQGTRPAHHGYTKAKGRP